ncbi:cell surface protein [Nibricoccus aquaticus]|uniref:Cell surface protein n=1 Tax=Nibricoccus aquaticus TaxID=2576891 RepID=A0A290QP10_9BACT|nr:IPT/TIG domain-containing protein [Nibricoccus aquaticus]ATC66192.1 cell surface protein [Nibricoccus aquaticus]
MQNTRFSQARRFVLGLGIIASLTLVGCKTTAVTNLTPGSLPANPSQIYTISARIKPKLASFVQGTVLPSIVIDGQKYRMTKSNLGEDIFEFDYQLAAGRTELAYYFEYTYQVSNNGTLSSREDYTQVQRATIVGRYVLSLEVNRGPVGAKVSILGRGFTPADVVYFDNAPVRTVFESANSISFYVPSVDANRNYKVSIGGNLGQSPAGTFRVDGVGGVSEGLNNTFSPSPSVAATNATGGTLLVNPTALSLKKGQKVNLTFTTPVTASAGGLLIDITTDVPESVIMPEVIVPAGSNTVTISIEAGRPGTGSLFAKGPGVKELVIPVKVQ